MKNYTLLLSFDELVHITLPEMKVGKVSVHIYCIRFNVPSARNSAGKSKQRSSKDGNRYFKIVFTDAAIHAVQYYPVIRKYHNSLLRKKSKQIAKTIIAKEIAEIVFHILKNKTNLNNKFKCVEIQHKKSLQWPRVVSPDV